MKEIWLTHISALCFHPGSLDSMIELESLILEGPFASRNDRDFFVRNTTSTSYSSLETVEYADSELEFDEDEEHFWESESNHAVRPALKKLILGGSWVISPKTLRILLTKTLGSSLQVFHYETRGSYKNAFTIEQWIEYTKQHPKLVDMILQINDVDQDHLTAELNESMLNRYGLEAIYAAPNRIHRYTITEAREVVSRLLGDPSQKERLWLINGKAIIH
ncbi:hypothetical protein BGW42_007568 [Actinomortierella wolfii]|nr:hypothetical protein BGW42_007568 [Actinomortierella wolfii]